MQGYAVLQGIKNGGQEPSKWAFSEYHKLFAPFGYFQLREQVNNGRMVVSPLWCGPGNIYGFVLDRQNPTGKNGLLLKHQTSPPFPAKG